MTLTIDKTLTEDQRAELALELAFGSIEGTLTESRYDEIVEILFQYNKDGDARMGIISEGQPAWRKKHLERYNAVTAMQTA
jgi:hypothetical protein